MNHGGRGNSRGGKSQVSSRRKPPGFSPNYQNHVRDDVSPGGSVSSTSVESSYSSGHATEKNSGVGMYGNAIPATRQGGGWFTFGSGSSYNEGNVGKSTPSTNAIEKSNSSGHALEKNSGGGIYRNVTPATRRKSQGSWRPKPPEFSPNNQTPVRDNVSFGGSMSSASVEKSFSSGQAAEKNSGSGMYRNVTPATRQRGGWATFGNGSSSNEGNVGKSTPSSNAAEKNSGGGIYRNVTPATRRGGGGGWSKFGSGSSSSGGNVSSNASGFHRDEQFGLGSGQLNLNGTAKALSKGDSDRSSVNLDLAFMESLVHTPEAAQLSGESVPLKSCSEVKTPKSTDSLRETENSEFPIEKFDLCPPRKSILRPGMVLLKNYLSISEQASILKICREHGLVNVGFYQPQFDDGGKMHLKLMCFGQFWDPKTCQYEEVRLSDHSKPPPIPRKLLELVDRAVKDSQSLISERERVKNVESILPSVKPDICLVNYYSKTGRLGLHQDKGESQESLRKGIPIVTFSIGDSAEFLYGDQRDVEKADKVVLESGDVLIFGGKSRHIFHGVPAIIPDTAPKMLLDETNFRSGRLSLTFRQRC
ncbi:uncharacterized protein LOC141591725 [Silene latifolia]|uniref:uncharacterized protein LOC141591725 n=1 Tax=Silene latifolia TaxID=37657 RepID=UPI003D774D2B